MRELNRLIKEGSTEKLWDLSAEILTELSRRDGVDFRIRATEQSVKTKTGQWGSTEFVETRPKKTRQGTGKHTKYAATSRNEAKKKYRGQGK